MKHVYLSPHLDDVVLSCGGAIHRQTTAGDSVLAITVFCGESSGDELSPFALQLHDDWGNVPQIMALRRAEDTAALALLGAEAQHLNELDAVYRADSEGRWLYTDLETLFGFVHAADPLASDGAQELADRFAERLAGLIILADQLTIYAPLGVGRHVDHQIVHMAARRLLSLGYHRLAFYEDYPYAERPGATEAALAAAAVTNWRDKALPLDPADLSAKVSALGYYRSQLPILFGGAEMMPNRVWSHAATRSPSLCLAERLWWPPEA
jgi:LmbE family N-acetylglucosaminyl deacetylase